MSQLKKEKDYAGSILIIDDEPSIREVLGSILREEGYYIDFAENGPDGYEKAQELIPDIVLLDVMMPGMDGFEVCRKIRNEPLVGQVPIVMLTALGDNESKIKGIESGADDFIPKPFNIIELVAKVNNITKLHRFRDSLSDREDLRQAHEELKASYDATIEGWARALELRDTETEGHSRRVTEMTLRVADAMGVGEENLEQIRRGALLHDIGKMGIPDSILFKPKPLTKSEWAVMKKHPVYAYELLSHIPFLRTAIDIPYCHHEKWDGTGYPRGLRGSNIPTSARSFAVADVWDALGAKRPYRPALPAEKIINHISKESGKHFDPMVVEVFMEFVLTEINDLKYYDLKKEGFFLD
jgi:putative two-component system response regulator